MQLLSSLELQSSHVIERYSSDTQNCVSFKVMINYGDLCELLSNWPLCGT